MQVVTVEYALDIGVLLKEVYVLNRYVRSVQVTEVDVGVILLKILVYVVAVLCAVENLDPKLLKFRGIGLLVQEIVPDELDIKALL